MQSTQGSEKKVVFNQFDMLLLKSYSQNLLTKVIHLVDDWKLLDVFFLDFLVKLLILSVTASFCTVYSTWDKQVQSVLKGRDQMVVVNWATSHPQQSSEVFLRVQL